MDQPPLELDRAEADASTLESLQKRSSNPYADLISPTANNEEYKNEENTPE